MAETNLERVHGWLQGLLKSVRGKVRRVVWVGEYNAENLTAWVRLQHDQEFACVRKSITLCKIVDTDRFAGHPKGGRGRRYFRLPYYIERDVWEYVKE